jgi:tetratricopeptide (TPR) repeat protein
MTPSSLRTLPRSISAIAALIAALLAAPVVADDAADVARLMRAGQYSEALGRVDAYLAKNPRDARMRFSKGVILTEQNKTVEAIAVFTRLTEDFPGLPEPFNNLAVLHAAAGQYEKARAALDAAIRTHPSYATAYDNLGDIHAKLASQAYDKALQLDAANAAAKSRLTMVRSLASNENARLTFATPSDAQGRPEPTAMATPARPPTMAASSPAMKPEPKAEQDHIPVTEPAIGEADQVMQAVLAWAYAWSTQDMQAYFGSYASNFQTPGGRARRAWEDDRRARIVGRPAISVKLESPQVSLNGSTATVRFRQLYVSDRMNLNTRRKLVLEKQGGKWLIKQEATGH